jgi:hypothetical protein
MPSNPPSLLHDIQAKLETALKTLESEYRRDTEARDLKYKRDRRPYEQALKGVQLAIASEHEGSALTEDQVDDLSLVDVTSNTAVHAGQQNDTRTRKFSLRREIEKILPEFEPGQDITQGKVRQRLEERFPEHIESLKPAAVYSALRRIARAGGLVLVSEGSGSTPNRYRLPEHGEENRDQEELSALRE